MRLRAFTASTPCTGTQVDQYIQVRRCKSEGKRGWRRPLRAQLQSEAAPTAAPDTVNYCNKASRSSDTGNKNNQARRSCDTGNQNQQHALLQRTCDSGDASPAGVPTIPGTDWPAVAVRAAAAAGVPVGVKGNRGDEDGRRGSNTTPRRLRFRYLANASLGSRKGVRASVATRGRHSRHPALNSPTSPLQQPPTHARTQTRTYT